MTGCENRQSETPMTSVNMTEFLRTDIFRPAGLIMHAGMVQKIDIPSYAAGMDSP